MLQGPALPTSLILFQSAWICNRATGVIAHHNSVNYTKRKNIQKTLWDAIMFRCGKAKQKTTGSPRFTTGYLPVRHGFEKPMFLPKHVFFEMRHSYPPARHALLRVIYGFDYLPSILRTFGHIFWKNTFELYLWTMCLCRTILCIMIKSHKAWNN